jgi:hypothetical protein
MNRTLWILSCLLFVGCPTPPSGGGVPDAGLLDSGVHVPGTDACSGCMPDAGRADTETPMADASDPGLDSGPAGDAGSDAGSNSDGGEAADAGAAGEAVVSGVVENFQSSARMGGVRVCVVPSDDTYPCATTSGQGEYRLNVPTGVDFLLTFSGTEPALLPYAVPMRLRGGMWTWSQLVVLQSVADMLLQAFGVTARAERGHVGMQLTMNGGGAGYAGGTIEINRVDPGQGGGEGPKYLDDQGVPSAEQTATGLLGLGFIFNNEPGDYTTFARPPEAHCTPHLMAPANDDGSIRTQVLAGVLTLAVFDCAGR